MGRGPPGPMPGRGVVGCWRRPVGPSDDGRAPGIGGRRWKIGCPGTGRPGCERAAIGCPRAAGPPGRRAIGMPGSGASGARYTGRGPVCGTMTRRCTSGMTRASGGAAGGCTAAGGSAGSTGGGAAGASGRRGAAGVVAAGRTGAAGGAMTGAAAGRSTAGAAGAATTMRAAGALGSITSGGAAGAAIGAALMAGAGATRRTAAGGAAGRVGTAGTAGAAARGSAIGGWACCVIAFSTSPGLEIFDRSNFVLISSAAGRVLVRVSFALSLSAWRAKCCRTRSASSTSRELECVFFSVTPTAVRTSRIALLLTSSSRARSLIRIFNIPPSCLARRCRLCLHCSLTELFLDFTIL